MQVLSLSGDWYRIGLQHGRKLRMLIRYALRYQDRANSAAPSEDALCKRVCEIEALFPELVAEMQGIADGARVPPEDIFAHNMGPIPEACSNVFFLSDRGPLLGHTNDDATGTLDVAFHTCPASGPDVLMVGSAGSIGAAAALNSDGLAMSHACARGDGRSNRHAPFNLPLLRRALVSHCGDCADARAFLSSFTFAGGADNVICVDRAGEAFVAEKLPDLVEFREPMGAGIYCTGRAHTRAVRDAVGQDEYERADTAIAPLLIAREDLFEQALGESELTLAAMKRLLANANPGVEVTNRDTTWAAILAPAQFEMWLVGGSPANGRYRRVGGRGTGKEARATRASGQGRGTASRGTG